MQEIIVQITNRKEIRRITNTLSLFDEDFSDFYKYIEPWDTIKVVLRKTRKGYRVIVGKCITDETTELTSVAELLAVLKEHQDKT